MSVGVFAITVTAVATGAARPTDERLRRKLLQARSPTLDAVSSVVTPLTSPPLLIAASLVTAFTFRHLGRRAWLPMASAPFLAMIAGRCFTATLPQQFAPASKDGKAEMSFPSGHTTGATAEALTIALVLHRNRMISRATAAGIALVPLVGGINRLYRDRHWSSDIVAGLSAGAAIAIALTK